MDSGHLHLLLNHLPVTGVLVALAIFGVGRLRGNRQFQQLALALVLLFGLATIPAYPTGASAEDVVKRLPGAPKALIEAHEEAATAAFVVAELLAGLGLSGLVRFRKSAAIPKSFAVGLLVLALSASGPLSWTGFLGGKIRHPEIRSTSQIAEGPDAEMGTGSHGNDD